MAEHERATQANRRRSHILAGGSSLGLDTATRTGLGTPSRAKQTQALDLAVVGPEARSLLREIGRIQSAATMAARGWPGLLIIVLGRPTLSSGAPGKLQESWLAFVSLSVIYTRSACAVEPV